MQILRERTANGGDIAEILDEVSRTRAAHSIRDTSFSAYNSHLRSICAVCDVLREQVVPAKLLKIRRYTAICNHAVTLRGHLAAWRLLHTVFGETWAGDKYPFIKAAQASGGDVLGGNK